MPFTLAHPLAAVPLRRLGLPLDALVVGAMIPDLVLFAPLGIDYTSTHAPLGTVTIDLVMGAILLALWRIALRAPVTDGAPRWVRDRLRPRTPREGSSRDSTSRGRTSRGAMRRGAASHRSTTGVLRTVLLSAIAIVLGAWTHIVWDGFTHDHGWVVTRVPALREHLAGLPVFSVLQYGSSVLGIAGLAWLAHRSLARRTAVPRPPRRAVPARLVLVLPVVVGAVTAGTILGATWGALPLGDVVYLLATRTVTAAALGLLLACALWWAMPPRATTTRVAS